MLGKPLVEFVWTHGKSFGEIFERQEAAADAVGSLERVALRLVVEDDFLRGDVRAVDRDVHISGDIGQKRPKEAREP